MKLKYNWQHIQELEEAPDWTNYVTTVHTIEEALDKYWFMIVNILQKWYVVIK